MDTPAQPIIDPPQTQKYADSPLGQDEAEQKKMDESKRLQSEVMKNISEGIYLIKLDTGIIVYTNPKFETMFGYAPGEMIGKEVSIVNAPTEKKPEETKNTIIEILTRTGEWHGEVENIKKDGTRFWCYANVSLFDHHEYGKVLVSVHTDITDRKKTEELLRKSNELYESTIAAINDGVWDWDVQTGNAFFSETYYKMLGYTDKEFPANYATWKSLVHPDDVERAEKELQEGIVSEKGFAINFRMKMKSGEWLWVSTRGKAIEKDKEGKAVRMVGTLTDITKQMQAEQSLQKKIVELEQMNSLMVGREMSMVELK